MRTFGMLESFQLSWPARLDLFDSPFRADRLHARRLPSAGCFLEVFVNAPLAVCEARDVKGLYRRARANEISDFTGISSVYEQPEPPELEVRSDLLTVEASVAVVLEAVKKRLFSLSKHDLSAQRGNAHSRFASPAHSQPVLSKQKYLPDDFVLLRQISAGHIMLSAFPLNHSFLPGSSCHLKRGMFRKHES
jgi:hypothetical protein